MVGSDDLIARIQEGGSSAIDFDKAVATPGMKGSLGRWVIFLPLQYRIYHSACTLLSASVWGLKQSLTEPGLRYQHVWGVPP